MIQVEHVHKNYGNTPIIKDLSLTIEKGKLTALIGPNGAGKTTFLNMIGRLTPVDGGKILIDGKDLSHWNRNDLAKRLAILKQKNTMTAQITVRELLAFGRFPHMKGKIGPKCKQLIKHSLKYLGMEEYEYTYLNDLSGGQLQRDFIGMVLCQDTDYILLDEPLNNLDMKYGVQIMNILRDLVDEMGRTVIIVLHDINFAAAYADRIVGFKDGEKFIDDVSTQVIQKPVIDELFDMDVEIIKHNQQNYCLYYQDRKQFFNHKVHELNEVKKAVNQ
ncbi:MAG TPA: ATP-binding cassette domain-containing protein [Gallicola sp.]|uniref:Iron complex transport system ATP-binding protein n=1 Tax=Atopostipes suicloacalis DSM 15692 TaxID=1121025 RepID=A0A1M4USC6_9LACT|nr:ATP-binding cassette domain-containing protein [Atopostipes suicloacalis]SHE59568.1 iron complex transport system ATP-binding protein [Atopostipes suicloacalis DSM 15692]HHX66902.1 ATP-binding cassette domain-containing protein [Gallicola sp.]